jgi:hypothetical protein
VAAAEFKPDFVPKQSQAFVLQKLPHQQEIPKNLLA